jgi:hypothetical protein
MKVENVIELLGDKIFTVTFVKKDGTVRVLNGRRKVTKHLKGGELAYDPIEKGLIPVYDLKSEGYRMINSQTVLEIKSEKQVYTFEEGELVENW